jgi:hypothetical protein
VLLCYDADPVSFHVGKAMIASSASASKGSGGKDVCLAEPPPLLGEPSPDVEDTLARVTGVLDIVLTSGHGGAVSRNAVCGLLTECLQDVSCAIHVMLCLFALMLDFLFFFVSVLGYEIN